MPGWVMTIEGEIKVMSVSEAAQVLGCEVADIFRWHAFDLVDVVLTPKGEILPFYEEIIWLKKEGERYADWPYDRILWRRYERDLVMRRPQERPEEEMVVDADAALAATSWVDEEVVEDVIEMARQRAQQRTTQKMKSLPKKPLPPKRSGMSEQRAAWRVF